MGNKIRKNFNVSGLPAGAEWSGNMDNVLNQIIDIEHSAQEMIKKAEEEKKGIIENSINICSEIKKDILARQEKRLDIMLQNEQKIADEKTSNIKEQSAAKLDILMSLYSEKKEAWIQDIYNNIIGR